MSRMSTRSRCSRPSTAASPRSTRSCAAFPTTSSASREPALHRRLKQLADSLPQLKSAWIFDANGKSLVNSLASPPPDQSFADRDYFYAHVDQSIGTFIGASLTPRQPYQGARFFGVSRRRSTDDGSFIGVIQASVLPEYFESFYARIGTDPGSFFAMGRTDGVLLAHFPRLDRDFRLDPNGPVGRSIAAHPEHGLITIAWPSDGIERRIGYRRVAEYPIYVSAGLETSAIRARWLATMSQHLVFGVPATALLFILLALAFRRTQHLQLEAAKRREAEEALKHSQRLEALGQLTGGVAHDFNNLLTVIRASVDLLNRPQISEERRQRYITAIADAVARAAKLTSQLLAFARRQTLKPEVFDVGDAMQSLRDMLATLLGSRDRDRRRSCRPSPASSMPMPASSRPRMINMATNARDAMHGKGRIVFTVRRGDECCRDTARAPSREVLHGFVGIAVSDTGIGIPADAVRPHLRAVLHHQAGRPGHRPRPVAGVRLRPAIRRRGDRHQRGRPGQHLLALSAARAGGSTAAAAARRTRHRRSPAAACRCWWSRTISSSAISPPTA